MIITDLSEPERLLIEIFREPEGKLPDTEAFTEAAVKCVKNEGLAEEYNIMGGLRITERGRSRAIQIIQKLN